MREGVQVSVEDGGGAWRGGGIFCRACIGVGGGAVGGHRGGGTRSSVVTAFVLVRCVNFSVYCLSDNCASNA